MARLMKSMLINRDTLALYIPRVLKTIKIEPHNTSISKLQITWVCRITCSRYTKVARSLQLPGSVLKKTCPSVLTRGYSLPKSVKASPPLLSPSTSRLPQSGAQRQSSSRELRQGADDWPKSTGSGIPAAASRGKNSAHEFAYKDLAEKVSYML